MTATALAHVTPGDAEYQRLSRLEAEFWRSAHTGFGVEALEAADVDSPIERYTNRRFTGEPRTPWYETIARYGRFQRGLALGTSGLGQDARILRTNPGLRLTFCDISPGSLARWNEVLGRRFPGRVETLAADLNFVDLPESSYDVIVSSSTLHHVINLEDLARQINRALAPGGFFFLQDYVGESFFRFAEAKKRLFEALYERDIQRQPGRAGGLTWRNEDRSLYSPFCGIRSADILGAMEGALEPVTVRTAGALTALMLYVRPADGATAPPPGPARRAQAWLRRRVPLLRRLATPVAIGEPFLRELMFMDELACDAGLCLPNNAFAVYRKRTGA
jgi:SAM-dependent methyltransferase